MMEIIVTVWSFVKSMTMVEWLLLILVVERLFVGNTTGLAPYLSAIRDDVRDSKDILEKMEDLLDALNADTVFKLSCIDDNLFRIMSRNRGNEHA